MMLPSAPHPRLRSLLALTISLLATAACVPRGLAEQPASGAWTDPDPSPFTVGPYLLRSKPGQMLVVVKAPLSEPPVVEWWTTPSKQYIAPAPERNRRRATGELWVDLWVTQLDHLPLDSFIAYRVRSELGDTEPEVFKAGATRGKPFRFAFFGDTRTNHNVHRAVIDAVAKQDIDFFVHTGDMVQWGGREPEWETFFRIERPLTRRAAIFPSIGNHDMSPRDFFGRYFLTTWWSSSLSYYYQDWGDLRVVAVDTGIECRDGCVQNWFARRALAEGARRNMLMILSMHFPPYSSGAHGSTEHVREAVEEIATKYGVELVLAGHDHNYERTKKIKGVTYVVSGAAGAPIRPVKKQHFSEVVRTEPHFVLADVNRDRIALRAINLQGETFDDDLIPALAPRGR